jgi:hypothetical protein
MGPPVVAVLTLALAAGVAVMPRGVAAEDGRPTAGMVADEGVPVPTADLARAVAGRTIVADVPGADVQFAVSCVGLESPIVFFVDGARDHFRVTCAIRDSAVCLRSAEGQETCYPAVSLPGWSGLFVDLVAMLERQQSDARDGRGAAGGAAGDAAAVNELRAHPSGAMALLSADLSDLETATGRFVVGPFAITLPGDSVLALDGISALPLALSFSAPSEAGWRSFVVVQAPLGDANIASMFGVGAAPRTEDEARAWLARLGDREAHRDRTMDDLGVPYEVAVRERGFVPVADGVCLRLGRVLSVGTVPEDVRVEPMREVRVFAACVHLPAAVLTVTTLGLGDPAGPVAEDAFLAGAAAILSTVELAADRSR